jgi:hypothetical protein
MPALPRLTGAFRFSTAGIPVQQCRRMIGSLCERGLLPIEPIEDDAVTLSIAKRFLRGAYAMKLASRGHRARRDPTRHWVRRF